LDGESVSLKRVEGESGEGEYVSNIGTEVDDSVDLDVQLKLALYGGRPVIYWKETYLHRMYRQGLFGLGDWKVAPLCEGTGGLYRSH
jgi:hypothetical protein